MQQFQQPSPAHSFAPNTSFRHLLQITLTDLEEFQQLVGIEIKKLRKKIPLIKSQEMMGREMIRASESLIEYLLLKLPQIEAERILTAELSIRGMHGGQTFYDPNRISRGGDYFVPSLDQINKAMEAVDHAVQVSDSEVNLEESQKKLKGKNVGTHILTQKDLSAQNLSPSKEKGNSGLVYNHDVGAQAIVSNKDIGAMAYYSQRDMSAMAYNSQRDMSAQNTLHSYKNISQQYTGRVPQNKSIQHSRRGHSQGVQNIVSQKDMTQQYTQLSEVDEGIQYTNNITEKGLQYSNHGQDRSIQNIQSHKDQSIQNLQENKDQSIQKQQSIMNKSIQNLQSLRDESVQNLVMLQDQSVSNYYDNRDKSVQNLVDQRDQSLSNLYDARDQSIQNLYECRSMSIQNVQDYKDQNIQNIQDMRDKSIQNLALHKDADVQNMPEMKEMAAQYSQRELLPNENLDAQFFDSTGLGYQSFNDLKSSLEAINSDFRQSLTWEIRELIKTIQGQQKEFQDAMESALATAINPSGDGQDAVDPVFTQDLDKSGFAELEKAKFLLQKNQKRIEEKQKQQQEQLIKKFEEFIGKKQQEFNVQQLEVLRDIKRSLQLLEQLQESMNTVNTGVNDVHDYLKQRLITKSKQETYQENLELKALDFIQNTTGVGFMKKKSSYALAQFESYMAAQIAPDLIAVHNKLCSVDIIKFPQMTHVALINPEMRNCFSALGGRETFYLGMVDGVAEYDYRTFTKQKVFNTKSYVYHIYGFDNQCIVCCQKEGYIQVLAREDFSLLIDTQLSDKVSIGEMKKTSRPYEVMFATSRAVIFGFLQRNQDVDQGITFKENFDEKYVIAKGVDSIIEYYKDQLAICTNDGISLINRATRQVSFFIQNPNKSTPRFIKELPGLNMNDYPYLLFRDEVNMYIVDLKNKRLYNILKVTYTKNYLCKYQTFIVNGPNQPLELVVLQYDDRDSTVTHYVMKDQYHHALQVLKDM